MIGVSSVVGGVAAVTMHRQAWGVPLEELNPQPVAVELPVGTG